MRYLYSVILTFFVFGQCWSENYPGGLPGTEEWTGFRLDSIQSPMDGQVQKFYFYQSTKKNSPLVVSLHQWSSDYSNFKNSLAPQTRAKDWNFLHPDFRGANTNPKACGSDYVIADIDAAIDWAVKNLQVDAENIYIIGASGGGYAALCHFMKSRYKVKEYSVWVPITDLKRWYFESEIRGSKYAADVTSCTCSQCAEPDFEEANRRSPMFLKTPLVKLDKCRLQIYAGIHDGYTGAVPIVHSVLFFNKVVSELGGTETEKVALDDLCWMLTTRTAPQAIQSKIGEREIHISRKCGNVSLTIFEGTHEILVDSVFPEIESK